MAQAFVSENQKTLDAGSEDPAGRKSTNFDDFLSAVVDLWGNELFRQSYNTKARFNAVAEKGVKFYGGDHDFIFEEKNWGHMAGRPKTTINKTDDAVSLFGPSLFFTAPHREVTARRGNDEFASVLELVLNYLGQRHNLESRSKQAITEALVKGACLLWASVHPRTKMPYSEFVGISDFFPDPDVLDFKECKWALRRWAMPVWEVRRRWPETARDIRPVFSRISDRYRNVPHIRTGTGEDTQTTGDTSSPAQYVWVYEIWSRMGLGQLSDVAPKGMRQQFKKARGPMRGIYDVDIKEKNLVITISPMHPVPLEIREWPVPFFRDVSPFPFEVLYFKNNVDELWPKAIMQSSMGLQEMIDMMASFIMQKAKDSSKDFIFCLEDMHSQIETALAKAADNSIIPIQLDQMKVMLKDAIMQVKGGGVDPNLIGVFETFMELFEQSSGLVDIMLGVSGSDRETATSVQTRTQASNIRVDQMVKDVELWQSNMAKKEAILAYALMSPGDVEKIVGTERQFGFYVEGRDAGVILSNDEMKAKWPALTGYFDTEEQARQVVAAIGSMNPDEFSDFEIKPCLAAKVWEDNMGRGASFIIDSFDIEIAVGSGRRPNKEEKLLKAQTNFKTVALFASQVGDLNAVNKLLKNMYDAQDLPEAERVYLNQLPQDPQQMQLAMQQQQLQMQQSQQEAEAAEAAAVPERPSAIMEGKPIYSGRGPSGLEEMPGEMGMEDLGG